MEIDWVSLAGLLAVSGAICVMIYEPEAVHRVLDKTLWFWLSLFLAVMTFSALGSVVMLYLAVAKFLGFWPY